MRFWQRLTSHHNCFHGSLWHWGRHHHHHNTATLQRNMTTRDWRARPGLWERMDKRRREGGRGVTFVPSALPVVQEDSQLDRARKEPAEEPHAALVESSPRLDGIRGKTHALFIPHLHNNMGKMSASGRGGGAGGGGLSLAGSHTSPATCSWGWNGLGPYMIRLWLLLEILRMELAKQH